MKETLRKAIPEFDQISDAGLRDKTLAVWVEAMQVGGWTVPDLEKMPFTLLIENCPASMLDHTRGVTKTAVSIGQTLKQTYGDRLPINMDYLTSGALLHDVGKLLEYEKKDGKFVKSSLGKALRHPFSGTCIAYKHELPPEVMHTIANHSKEGDHGPRSTEGCIIHHADFCNFEPFHTKK
jgi:putative nucleotidyltransferase with HDIG domain